MLLASLSRLNAFQQRFLDSARFLQIENDLDRASMHRSAHTTEHREPCGRFDSRNVNR